MVTNLTFMAADNSEERVKLELKEAQARLQEARRAYRVMMSEAGSPTPGTDGVLLIRQTAKNYRTAQEEYMRAFRRHMEYLSKGNQGD
jgi:hypothetical protein